ncbi:hypothetical protein HHK36_011603 [Tetracentron sinense]|uniref:Uncharacterized protein n=1 Tax=Tetracentron sinense TaxID=13715 RepID=A0A834Z9R1_TETSI|nr:hypothetical protein HHK36_011603 [Tetracentron sinense]
MPKSVGNKTVEEVWKEISAGGGDRELRATGEMAMEDFLTMAGAVREEDAKISSTEEPGQGTADEGKIIVCDFATASTTVADFEISHMKRYQILIAQRLVEEGINCWNLIFQHHHPVLWEKAVFEIEEQFMKISQCTTRALSEQVKGKAEKPSNRLQRAISKERICLQENVLKN